MRPNSFLVVFGLLCFFTTSLAHTWVEQLNVIASNGTFVGLAGFPRGNIRRNEPGFGDGVMTYLLPPNGRANSFLPTDLMCKSSQTKGSQTATSPSLHAAAGDMIALRYQENGHVTLPATQVGKPANRGTVFIYGTSQPSNGDTFLNIHNVWNAAGTGGDGRGVLLATRNYDDGQCYQLNGSPISQQRQQQFSHANIQPMGVNMWCQSDVTLPSNINAASYTLYWVWEWPTLSSSGAVTLNETYTTCMDVIIDGAGPGTSKGLSFAKGQDLNFAAIQSELETAFIVAPTAAATGVKSANIPPTVTGTATASAAAANTPVISSSPAAASSKATNPSGAVTVTVTEDAIIQLVTVSVTVTATPGAQSSASKPVSNTPALGTGLSIAPFLANDGATLLTKVSPTPCTTSAMETAVNVVTVDMTEVVTVTTRAARPKIKGRGW